MNRSPPPSLYGEELQFKRLSTWKQVGLGGLTDCKNAYFVINLSICSSMALLILFFALMLTFDQEFDVERWGGEFTGDIACEANSTEGFVLQRINAVSCVAYGVAGLFILQLGCYDRHSWKERDALWRETHLVNRADAANDRRVSFAGNSTLGRGGNPQRTTTRGRLPSVGSINTAQTGKTTFSIEHEEITERRKYNEYIMGKQGSPCLMIRQPIWSYVFTASMIFLAFTGFLFHASLSNTAKRLDDFALWVVISLLVAYAWTRYFADGTTWKFLCIDCRSLQDSPRRSSLFSTSFFLILTAITDFAFFLYLDDITDRDFIRATLVIALIMFSVPMFLHYCNMSKRIGSSWTLLVVCMGFLLAGFLLNEFDVPEAELCFPDVAFFQAHALWHIISALGVALIVLFFRSDFYLNDVPLDGENSPRLLQRLNNLMNFRNPFLNQSAQDSAAATSAAELGPVQHIRGVRSNGSEAIDEESAVQRFRQNGRPSMGMTLRSEITLDEEVPVSIEMWTCLECSYKDNSMESDKVCKRCGKNRPSIDQFVAIPLTSNGNSVSGQSPPKAGAPSQSSFSVGSGSKARTLRRGKKKNRTLRSRIPKGSVDQSTNPRVKVTRVSNARPNGPIHTVSSQGSHTSAGRVSVRSKGRSVTTAGKAPIRVSNTVPSVDGGVRVRTAQERQRQSRARSKDRPVSKERTKSAERPISKERPKSTERPKSKTRPKSTERPKSKSRPKSKERPRSKERQRISKAVSDDDEDIPI